MPVNHSTRSVNCLIRSPKSHNVTSNTSQWGGNAGIQQTFAAAGTWTSNPNTFTQDTNASYEIPYSSLKVRHGQARVMSWASLNVFGNTWQFDKYDNDYSYTRANSPSLVLGQPTYVYPNYQPNGTSYGSLTGTPLSPCEMSTFSANGRTNEFADVFNSGQGYSYSSFRQIIMDAPPSNTNPNPISIGPTSGV
tara:strand:+ start:3973 stop:4551 length:579 start_codon:yes stop_codon:yes gene_type:complete